MIKVLIVDDSPVVRELLTHIIGKEVDLVVVGAVNDGEEAVHAVAQLRPDVVTMDISMPGMGGFAATRAIMESHPVPIVVVTGSSDSNEVATTFQAIEAGALTVVPRPVGPTHPGHEHSAKLLTQTLRLMAEVRVVQRWPHFRSATAPPWEKTPVPGIRKRTLRAVVIGASTGGPMALQALLSRLPEDFPAPVLIVQHLAEGFAAGFVEWLSHACPMPVALARDGMFLAPAHVFVAPDGSQMGIAPRMTVQLAPCGSQNGLCPSVAYLFRSACEICGNGTAAVLLSGMGKDGAVELAALRGEGAVTFAQDAPSSVVHGMPGEAITLDGASFVMTPEQIADALIAVTSGIDIPQ